MKMEGNSNFWVWKKLKWNGIEWKEIATPDFCLLNFHPKITNQTIVPNDMNKYYFDKKTYVTYKLTNLYNGESFFVKTYGDWWATQMYGKKLIFLQHFYILDLFWVVLCGSQSLQKVPNLHRDGGKNVYW